MNMSYISAFLFVVMGMNWAQTIAEYQVPCPEQCVCTALEISADCQNGGFSKLPNGLHPETTRLDLSFNKFTSIPKNVSALKELVVLVLAHNEISSLDQDSFDSMNNLQLLDLSNNRLTDWRALHPGSLTPLKSLKQLDLSHNHLRGFPAIVEYPLRSDSLKTLILNNCSITNVFGDILAGMVNAEKLVLSFNPLTSLNAILRAEKLRTLEISNCALQRISADAFTELVLLETLILSNNGRLKRFYSTSRSLKFLDLSNCSIESYPTNSLPNLNQIYLRNNQIKNLQEMAFITTPSIKVLSLSHNSISSIDERAFVGLNRLEDVDLSYNTISSIGSRTFSGNAKLTKLSLSHNYLNKVDHIATNSVKALDMSVCEIRSVDRTSLSMMPSLEELNLARNLISFLPDNWTGYRIHSLDLSLNRIFTLTNETFNEMPFLRNLNLAGNRLTSSIKPEYFHNINIVRLDDNSWLCDCKNVNFKNLYDWLINKMHSTTQLRCMFPENLAGLPWELACEEYWYVQENRSDKVWVFSVFLMVGTVTLICIIMSIRRAYQLKEIHERQLVERERIEVRDRLRRMQEQQYQAREEEINQRNAPDPREIQRPPSYAEAILMPRLDGSYSSLAGSQFSLSGSHRNLSGSRRSLRGSQSDLTEGKVRRKRRRSRHKVKTGLDGDAEGQSSERLNTEEATSDSETRQNNENSARSNDVIESDFELNSTNLSYFSYRKMKSNPTKMSYQFCMVVAFVFALTEALRFAQQSIKCPKSCNCTDTSTAECNSLDVEVFQDKFAILKIVNPSEPLVLTRNIFHDIGLKSVNHISIENATITEIDEEAFGQLTTLIKISILRSDVHNLPSKLISNVKTIRALNLAGTKLGNFTTLKSETLEELDMSKCQISEITENMFNNLPELIFLNLGNNNIRKIHSLAFINLTNLESLSLARNNLTHLQPNLLENNMELVTLNLSYNPIEQFNLNIISILEALHLKGCKLKSFNATFGKNFDILPYLDLSENEIEHIPKNAFANMKKLETINLASNRLENLDATVFDKNSELAKIILDNNNIKKLPKFTNKNNFFDVMSFSCNNCNLTELSRETFVHMRGLTILHLSNNQLTKIDPEIFEAIPGLREIDISHNKISEFDVDTFASLGQLEKLIIAGNPLTKPLDATMFNHNRVLKSIDASSCHLKKLWAENTLQHASMPSIRELLISNNELQSVSPRDLQVLTNLQILDIKNNPIECSQILRDTITWLTEREVRPAFTKTHESFIEDVNVFDETEDKVHSWKKLAKDACEDEEYFDNYYNDEVETEKEIDNKLLLESKLNIEPKTYTENSDEYDEDEGDDDDDEYNNYIDYDQKSEENSPFDEDDDKLFEQIKSELDLQKLAVESRRLREKKTEESFAYLSPTLVFILTAASVLVIAANAMLLILRSRGALVVQRDGNLPHFKIPQWGAGNKLKKHSGSVYQQLSEERTGPPTPKVNRYQKLPTVHNSIP
ncbi:uncharacterized protein LOC108738182 [Agrilus planipennis]|uniref:Uncharacterized protein LOC108738182 n=1 Tax=Agrilus planipennis TaxID=224129 RepID=A0A1W4X2F3_AGRPL|nr:uncharacterized protein LOC108738182 [Agrilus planipennis]